MCRIPRRNIHYDDPLRLLTFSKIKLQGRASIATSCWTNDFLRSVKMPQRNILGACRKARRVNGERLAYVNGSFSATALRPEGKQMGCQYVDRRLAKPCC